VLGQVYEQAAPPTQRELDQLDIGDRRCREICLAFVADQPELLNGDPDHAT
jgi:hypothetical protein